MFKTKQECIDYISDAFDTCIVKGDNDFENFGIIIAVACSEIINKID